MGVHSQRAIVGTSRGGGSGTNCMTQGHLSDIFQNFSRDTHHPHFYYPVLTDFDLDFKTPPPKAKMSVLRPVRAPCTPNKKGAPKGELTLRTSVITHSSKGELALRGTFFI